MTKPELAIEIDITPAFHDVDAMKVVWHGNYVRYMEVARCALLQRLGYDYPQMDESGYLWPVVDMRVKYVRPLRYGQRIRVRCEIVEWENRLRTEYTFSDAQTGERLTRGTIVQVAVDATTNEMLFVCPPVLWERLGVTVEGH
ncbi:acyl-CoA thioesterase [Uliginosibacterium sp. sgz301328]|uniref:acyl-CoA thioesterase n=1 Tax=Uliginosibacterium sp. sgz301328 TaxID=3243764 RepID=UPI00359DE047